MTSPSTLTRTWSAVLFDLDGTIIDSAADITASLAHTFSTLGLPVPDDATLRSYVGPPLTDVFAAGHGLEDALADEAVATYRAHYADHVLSSPVFPGVRGLLERLHTTGIPIALATSKPEHTARAVLDNAGLTQFFTVITGATTDGTRGTKAQVVAEALRRLQDDGIDTEHAVMVGDRSHDTIGALANGVPTILVEWGYGSPAEADDALAIVHSTDQLRGLLIG